MHSLSLIFLAFVSSNFSWAFLAATRQRGALSQQPWTRLLCGLPLAPASSRHAHDGQMPRMQGTSPCSKTVWFTHGGVSRGPAEAVVLHRLQAIDPTIADIQMQTIFKLVVDAAALPLAFSIRRFILEGERPEAIRQISFPLRTRAAAAATSHVDRVYLSRPRCQSVWSSNVRSVLSAIGIPADLKDGVRELEAGRWYRINWRKEAASSGTSEEMDQMLHDSMLERQIPLPAGLSWAHPGIVIVDQADSAPSSPSDASLVSILPLGQLGPEVLRVFSTHYGLGLGSWEISFLTDLFLKRMKRDPTDIEVFDVAQSLSEHCRHWTFTGRFIIDGEMQQMSLMDILGKPLLELRKLAMPGREENSLIAFCDNSSAIKGHRAFVLQASCADKPSSYRVVEGQEHILLTAETHNFPSSIAPFPGAQTGVGGRIRDLQATGRGGKTLAGMAGYAVGELSCTAPASLGSRPVTTSRRRLASPLSILLRASDGASDYANKYGEPLVGGFARIIAGWRGHEFLKPIVFSAGVGLLPDQAVAKGPPLDGMTVVKIGGPAYRVGMGGGAASSKVGEATDLDLQAVQRGNPEMGNRVGRAIRACLEMPENPIRNINDQGAGGNANVLKELVAPNGADIYLDDFDVGDSSMTPLEIWGAEYQESQAILSTAEGLGILARICEREGTPCQSVGKVSRSGALRLYSGSEATFTHQSKPLVDLPLRPLLAERPRRDIIASRIITSPPGQQQGSFVSALSMSHIRLSSWLQSVLSLVSVGSKAFLTNKVDRSVGGLVAAQPCIGPFHMPIHNVGVSASSYWGHEGSASALGECPGIGLSDVKAMARVAVAEALTNLVWAPITRWQDIKLQANWMWPGREGRDAAALHDAVVALAELVERLGLAIDGGKDSLSMAVETGEGKHTPSPPTVVITAYAPCSDVRGVITPDAKLPSEGQDGSLLLLQLRSARLCLAGSALAQVLETNTARLPDNDIPDVDDPACLRELFEAVQHLAREGLVRAGHDISSGGLITTVIEMAMAGGSGAMLTPRFVNEASTSEGLARFLFSEEVGVVVEIAHDAIPLVMSIIAKYAVFGQLIGSTVQDQSLKIIVGMEEVFAESMFSIKADWQATSVKLERLQANPECVDEEERLSIIDRRPNWSIPFRLLPYVKPAEAIGHEKGIRPRMAVLREKGSNGDREMAAAFMTVGFEVYDLTVSDLVRGDITLDVFQGLALVGGFSFGDVLGSARGWASVLQGNQQTRRQLQAFLARPNTWSLGICNGCQVLTRLGVVPEPKRFLRDDEPAAWLRDNKSGRFESRFVTVSIAKSPSVLLKGMEGAVLGVWSAHAEGRFGFRRDLKSVLRQHLAPVRYLKPDNPHDSTMAYPYNPNGSPEGIAALCSTDGRHLAIMPHPERCWLRWQVPWVPNDLRDSDDLQTYTPWFRLFQNAYEFSVSTNVP